MDINWKIDKFYLLFASIGTFHPANALTVPGLFMLLIAFGYRIGVTMGYKMAFSRHHAATKRQEPRKIHCQLESRPTIEGHMIA
jgi:hypothetical protein